MPTTFEKYVVDRLAPALAGHSKPTVMLLTCMDYRYAQRIINTMDEMKLRQKYDIFVLAGAAAGANQNATWRQAFVSHVRTAITVGHPIDRFVILEHRDCGAYRAFFQLEWKNVTPPEEFKKHEEQVNKFIADMKQEFAHDIPNLVIDSVLLARDEDDDIHMETPTI